MWRLSVLIAVLLLPGCCFIGCDEDVVLVPEAVVSVTDPSGNPIPDAVVTLARYEEHPHFRPLESWSSQAGAGGTATFSYKAGTAKQYPLMMHGVGSFAWQFCAEAPGRRTVVKAWNEPAGPTDVVELAIELPTGTSDPCSEVVEFEPRDVVPMRQCEADADCVYADVDPNDCCELCYGRILNVTANEEATARCADKPATGCQPCESQSFRAKSPRCLAGVCREPRVD